MFWLEISVLVVLVFLSAFFSGSETALVSLSKIRVNTLLKKKAKGSAALFRIKQDAHKLIITILTVNTLINIGAGSYATVIFAKMFGSSAIGIATGVMTFFILVFGEIGPKTFASSNAEKWSLKIARFIELLMYSLLPIIWVLEKIALLFLKILGSKKEKELSEEVLDTMITMGQKEGILNKDAAEIMHNVLEFKNTKVTQIMTPKAHIDMLDGNKKLKDVLNFVVKTPYSRYPVFVKDNDNIVGILDVDEILEKTKNKRLNVSVRSIVGKAFFIPESKEIDKLLEDFEKSKRQMAIVVDEYGNVVGIVTLEDILEEIVGDIFDKSLRTKLLLKKVDKKLIRADAKASVEEINKLLHLGLKEEHFDTLAGFIEHRLKRIPKKGERIVLKNVVLEVDKVTKQGIKSVKLYRG